MKLKDEKIIELYERLVAYADDEIDEKSNAILNGIKESL